MSEELSGLHVGLVMFSEPTLLIAGNSQSLLWLARQLSDGQYVDFNQSLDPSRTRVRFVPTTHEPVFHRTGGFFEWRMSADEASQVVDQLTNLAELNKPVHAYLDPSANQTDIWGG